MGSLIVERTVALSNDHTNFKKIKHQWRQYQDMLWISNHIEKEDQVL